MKNTTFEKSQTIANQQEINVENKQNYSEKLIERIPMEGTPFTLIRNEEEHFITIGQYKLTQSHKTPEEAIEEIELNHWNIITTLIDIFITHYNNKKS